jgi:hypothetical protein
MRLKNQPHLSVSCRSFAENEFGNLAQGLDSVCNADIENT